MGFKQRKYFFTVSIDFAKYRMQVLHLCHSHTVTTFTGALSLIMTTPKVRLSVPVSTVDKRTWGDREGHWGRWLWYVIVTKVIFSFRKSVLRDVRTDYNLDLRFLVNFNDNGGFVVGTHKHFSWGYKRSLFFAVYKRSLLAGYAKD